MDLTNKFTYSYLSSVRTIIREQFRQFVIISTQCNFTDDITQAF